MNRYQGVVISLSLICADEMNRRHANCDIRSWYDTENDQRRMIRMLFTIWFCLAYRISRPMFRTNQSYGTCTRPKHRHPTRLCATYLSQGSSFQWRWVSDFREKILLFPSHFVHLFICCGFICQFADVVLKNQLIQTANKWPEIWADRIQIVVHNGNAIIRSQTTFRIKLTTNATFRFDQFNSEWFRSDAVMFLIVLRIVLTRARTHIHTRPLPTRYDIFDTIEAHKTQTNSKQLTTIEWTILRWSLIIFGETMTARMRTEKSINWTGIRVNTVTQSHREIVSSCF